MSVNTEKGFEGGERERERMNNSISEQSFYIESEEEDEEKAYEKGENGSDSDGSDFYNDDPQQSKIGSLESCWPQSYR